MTQPLTQSQQNNALQQFLSENHLFVQGTCLDYLAIPHHPVTHTLVHIAERLAQTFELNAIQILMPGVAIESSIDNNNLSDIILEDVLQSHIELSPQYLIPVKSLNKYIQEPDKPLYSPYWFDDCLPKPATPEDIQALFNHSQTTQQLNDAFKTYRELLSNRENLLGQLNILGAKLKIYDAHGGIGNQSDAASGAYPSMMDFMQYYLNLEPCGLNIIDTPPKLKNLPAGQSIGYAFYDHRLYFLNRHENTITPITEPNHLAKFGIYLAQFENINDVPIDIQTPIVVKTNDGRYTFFPGKHLINASVIDINFPKEYQRIIYLSESNIPKSMFDIIASTGFKAPSFEKVFHQKFPQSKVMTSDDLAFIDIHTEHSFMSWYSRIPQDLRNEIELLWQLLHNPAKNIEATQNIITCIGTRGERIRSLTKRYEDSLCQIGMNPELQLKLLQEAKRVLDRRLQDFNSKPYWGCYPHLILTVEILKRYQKNITIQSLEDCYQLRTFQPKDLKVLLDNNPTLVNQLQTHLREQDNFIVYLSETPIRTLEVILPHFIEILKSNKSIFIQIMELLGTEKSNFLILQMLDMIQTAKDFSEGMRHLSPEQRPLDFDAFKDRLPNLILSEQDLFFVFRDLYSQQCKEVLDILKDCLINFIYLGKHFYNTILYLSPEQARQVVETLQDHWLVIIQNAKANNFFQNTIHILTERKRNHIWGNVPEFNYPIKSLSEGIEVLSINCKRDAIENFLANIKSQDSELIS